MAIPQGGSMRFALIFTALMASVSAYADSSFTQMQKLVYEKPSATLPTHPGLTAWSILTNLVGSEDSPTHGLSIRSRRTLVDQSDFRPSEPKWLHPRGACASGRWIVDQDSAATGLFTKGTQAPAIVRVSTGNGSSEYTGQSGRIFGMAVKVYPGGNPNLKVTTRNMIALDNFGFEASPRKWVFHGDTANESIYFTNVAPAKSALGKFLSSFFDRFDQPNFARPLYALASASPGGNDLMEWRTPYEIRYRIVNSAARPKKVFKDFREELVDGQPRTLEIWIESFDPRKPAPQKIGRLELDPFVVSDFCDLTLHFHHNPIEDQWAKYTDYEAVKGIQP